MLELVDQESTVIKSATKKKVKYTKLLASILRNKNDELKRLLEESEYLIDETPTNKMYEGKTLLFQACELERIECVNLLLAHGARTDILCDQYLAIDAACEICNTELIKLLYRNPIEIEFACWFISFRKACYSEQVDAVRLAVKELQAISFVPCDNYDLPSLQAFVVAIHANLSLKNFVRFFLIDTKIDDDTSKIIEQHNICISEEVVWLRRCVAIGCTSRKSYWVSIIEGLFEHITDLKVLLSIVPVSLIGRHISLALGSACALGNVPKVQLLLAYGADPNIRSSNGSTALHRTRHSTAQLLLDHGAEIEALNKYGATPLHSACASGELALIEFLQNKGAEISVITRNGSTVLHAACRGDLGFINRSKRVDVVRLVLSYKVIDIDAVDAKGYTALMYLDPDRDYDAFVMLVELGSMYNLYIDTGCTLLLKAIGSSFRPVELTRLLINRGADVNQAGQKTGETPLLKACLLHRTELVKFELVKVLLDAGADVDAPAGSSGCSIFSILDDTPEYAAVKRLCEQYINAQPMMK